MTNLTLTIDETQLRKARIVALERGTSVNAMVREFIANMTAEATQKKDKLAELEIILANGRIAFTAPRLTREETYLLEPRMQRLLRLTERDDGAANVIK